jgi:hypothetical protein|nr:hypothetical protein [Neorhizobium tomejilense]
MTAQNNEQPSQTLANPLSALHRAIEEANAFKINMTERLKKMLHQNGLLHSRNATLEQENRNLKARLQASESDNKRLVRDNEVLVRNQQVLDAAIQAACGTFMETTQFVSEATQNSITTLPLPVSVEPIAQPLPPQTAQKRPEIAVVRQQPTATAVPLDNGSEPRTGIKPLESYVAEAAPASISAVADDDALKAMTDEIDRMLEIDVQSINQGDDSAPAADGETKAA